MLQLTQQKCTAKVSVQGVYPSSATIRRWGYCLYLPCLYPSGVRRRDIFASPLPSQCNSLSNWDVFAPWSSANAGAYPSGPKGLQRERSARTRPKAASASGSRLSYLQLLTKHIIKSGTRRAHIRHTESHTYHSIICTESALVHGAPPSL